MPLERGLAIFSCTGSVDGVAGDMILLVPPFVITPAECDACVSILHDAISALEHEVRK